MTNRKNQTPMAFYQHGYIRADGGGSATRNKFSLEFQRQRIYLIAWNGSRKIGLTETPTKTPKRVFFIEMMGVPGSYDASVYDHFENKDQEGVWFVKRFGHLSGISIITRNACVGEALPQSAEVDVLVLAGSYNSVHDNTEWQQQVRSWLPQMREHKKPILAICGSHQLLAHMNGSTVKRLTDGPYAGTFPTYLTEEGKSSPLMKDIPDNSCFQFANTEHVLDIPNEGTLLAGSGRVPIAALDYGDHCYSTQFHPEGTHETLSTVWRFKSPELMHNYHDQESGYQLVENFLQLVTEL